MNKTLKLMESILSGEEGKVNEKELIKQYKELLLPNILAYFFKSNFNIICKTNQLYLLLDEEDKASFCLQELDKCLQNFDLDKPVKFITYFIRCYKNRLRTETENLMLQKRKAILNYKDLDEVETNSDMFFDDLDIILSNYSLSKIEQQQCKLLNDGYNLKEIANIFKQSAASIYRRNLKIKQKILNYNINFI